MLYLSTNVFQLGLARENECHPCPAGKYCSGAGIETFPSNISGDCEPGFFCVSGVNTPRPSQNFSGIGGVCPPGAYCPVETSEPIGCPNGTFSNVSQLESVDQCTPCSDGHYCGESNLTEPTGRQELDVCPSLQGSNLTFELNSHMASTCSGFTSHKRVSTSLGTSVQHKIKKMSKILLLSNVNKNCNIRKI